MMMTETNQTQTQAQAQAQALDFLLNVNERLYNKNVDEINFLYNEKIDEIIFYNVYDMDLLHYDIYDSNYYGVYDDEHTEENKKLFSMRYENPRLYKKIYNFLFHFINKEGYEDDKEDIINDIMNLKHKKEQLKELYEITKKQKVKKLNWMIESDKKYYSMDSDDEDDETGYNKNYYYVNLLKHTTIINKFIEFRNINNYLSINYFLEQFYNSNYNNKSNFMKFINIYFNLRKEKLLDNEEKLFNKLKNNRLEEIEKIKKLKLVENYSIYTDDIHNIFYIINYNKLNAIGFDAYGDYLFNTHRDTENEQNFLRKYIKDFEF